MGNKNSGQRRRPNVLQILHGVTRKDRLNPDEPIVPRGPVVMPAGLSAGAARMWAEMAPICVEMGTLTAADGPAFAKLCELEWTAREASAQKSQPGFSIFLHTTMVDSAGNEHQNVKVHPAIRIEGETAVKLRPFYDYFGMTPSGRARLRVPKAPEAPASKWAGELK